MGAIYQVKNNNKQIEYYANLARAKVAARRYLAERAMAREPDGYNISYNEKISYSRGNAILVLTACVNTRRGARRIFRQNIKCPNINEGYTCADGTSEFYAHIQNIKKMRGN